MSSMRPTAELSVSKIKGESSRGVPLSSHFALSEWSVHLLTSVQM